MVIVVAELTLIFILTTTLAACWMAGVMGFGFWPGFGASMVMHGLFSLRDLFLCFRESWRKIDSHFRSDFGPTNTFM